MTLAPLSLIEPDGRISRIRLSAKYSRKPVSGTGSEVRGREQ